MAITNKQIISVKTAIELPLEIPDYQRPYKWQANHINQLLDDVIRHKDKGRYRLGTVVIYRDKHTASSKLEVVDGQQRLITLTLICNALDSDHLCKPSLLDHEFQSQITIKNLQTNSAIIQARLKILSESEREELVDFLLHRCEVIYVELDNLSEAFQFFDSQNARGKALAPYDLLKAFHLREMDEESEYSRNQCVGQWEKGVDPKDSAPTLEVIMSDVLFRIRRWADGKSGINFTRNQIGTFKGVNLHGVSYRYTESLRAMNYMVEQYNRDPIREWDRNDMEYPFLSDQTMINGKRFFEYIEHYRQLYKQLFIDQKDELKVLLQLLDSKEYSGKDRTGDRYVRNLFECALLYYVDKFGDEQLTKVANICFVWAYKIRLEQQRVAIESVNNLAMAQSGLFSVIKHALYPHEILSMTIEPVTNVAASKVEVLKTKFIDLGYYHAE